VPRIVVVGNCQAESIAACLRVLIPGYEVRYLSWSQAGTTVEPDDPAAAIRSADILARQMIPKTGPDWFDALRERADAVVLPRIAFTGLHPDWIGMHGTGLQSALGANYSILAIAAFRLCVPSRRVADLFNAYTYARLGYFDEFHLGAAHMRLQKADITVDFDAWKGKGAFLHLPNHPTIEMIWSIAQQVCRRAGLAPIAAEPPPDPLLIYARWPVYPEIARRLGFEGSLQFRPPASEHTLDLEQMIHETFRSLEPIDASSFPWPKRVEAITRILAEEGV
jgi:hypothetical protein